MAPQIVLISGCSSGIGLSTAVVLAKDPEKRFKVFATMRNLAKKGQLEEEGKECLGHTLIIKQMDVCSDESVNKAVQEVISEEGRIDVLFNNAGIGTLPCPVECISTQLAKDLFDVNYFGTLRLIKAVLPSMKSKESGHIINNSSHFGVVAYPFFEVYASTKFAVEGLSESLAPTLRQFNIRCTLLEPGPVITSSAGSAAELTKGADLSKADKKSLQLMDSFQERMGQVLGHEDGLVSSDKIADLVKEIILTEKPNVRYQTHKKFGTDEIQAKLANPTGNKSVDIIAKRFCEEK